MAVSSSSTWITSTKNLFSNPRQLVLPGIFLFDEARTHHSAYPVAVGGIAPGTGAARGAFVARRGGNSCGHVAAWKNAGRASCGGGRRADGTLRMACAGYSYDVLPFGIATRNGLTVALPDGSRHCYTRLWWADVENRFGWLGMSGLEKCVSLILCCADGASEVAVNGHLFRIAPPLPAPRYTEQEVLQKLQDYFRN